MRIRELAAFEMSLNACSLCWKRHLKGVCHFGMFVIYRDVLGYSIRMKLACFFSTRKIICFLLTHSVYATFEVFRVYYITHCKIVSHKVNKTYNLLQSNHAFLQHLKAQFTVLTFSNVLLMICNRKKLSI
jgi:hypothetical protein